MKEFDLAFVINNFDFFKSHRKNLISFLANSGKSIAVITNLNGSKKEEIEEFSKMNIIFFNYQLNRSSLGVLSNFFDLLALYRILSSIKVQKLSLISAKPVVLGGLCSLIIRVEKVFYTISGLGYAFISKSLKARFAKSLILIIYKFLFSRKNIKVIFQNKDDLKYFVSKRILNKEKAVLIKGNGVDIKRFRRINFPEKLTFLFASRLLLDKGILEFIRAASFFYKKEASFVVAGDIDKENPNSISEEELNKLKGLLEIKYEGQVSYSKMQTLFNKAHIFVLPSYREGLPQAALEAAACSMPLILTDVNGCRDCLIDHKTGFLIKKKDVDSLIKKISLFIEKPHLVKQMGKKSREYIEENFSENKIHQEFLNLYEEK